MKNWLLMLCFGILSVVLGFVAFANPFSMSMGIERFAAWAFMIMGIAYVFGAFAGDNTGGRIWTVVLGVLMFLLGLFLFKNPLAGIMSLALAVSILAIVSGVSKIIAGLKIHANSLKWLTIISGVASIAVGILVFRNPFASLGILLGVELIVDGVALIALSLARKSGGVEATNI